MYGGVLHLAKKKGLSPMKRYNYLLSGLAGALLLSGCSLGGFKKDSSFLDPKNPTNITVWHYYNGAQRAAFDQLVDEFNRTVGKEQGVYVEAHSQGDVSALEKSVLASFNKDVGSSQPPDIFASYADTAYAIDQMGALVDLEEYLTEEDLAQYVESFLEEGRIGSNGELRIFPTAKSSEIFMMSKTDWEPFAAETGASLDALATMEGVAETAKAYYEWTDAKTPEAPNDGQAFYGRDAMANLFIIGSMQLGTELFHVDGSGVTIQVDEDVMKKIWDTYYVPFVKGYFAATGRFRSDDVATGELIAYTGSTTSANYFPATVETGTDSREIEYLILPAPIFEGGENYVVQQGAGMVVTKSTPKREYASVLFLKWFTQTENNLLFSCTSGYMPVMKDALSKEKLDAVIKDNKLEMDPKTYDTMDNCFDMVKDAKMYTSKAFENGAAARQALEYNLADKAAADRAAVEEQLAQGADLEETVSSYIDDAAFQSWLESFRAALDQSVNVSSENSK